MQCRLYNYYKYVWGYRQEHGLRSTKSVSALSTKWITFHLNIRLYPPNWSVHIQNTACLCLPISVTYSFMPSSWNLAEASINPIPGNQLQDPCRAAAAAGRNASSPDEAGAAAWADVTLPTRTEVTWGKLRGLPKNGPCQAELSPQISVSILWVTWRCMQDKSPHADIPRSIPGPMEPATLLTIAPLQLGLQRTK